MQSLLDTRSSVYPLHSIAKFDIDPPRKLINNIFFLQPPGRHDAEWSKKNISEEI